jgi:hypothetical protein
LNINHLGGVFASPFGLAGLGEAKSLAAIDQRTANLANVVSAGKRAEAIMRTRSV